jgi:hypothetical protein
MKGPPSPQCIPRTRGMVATTVIGWRALPLSTTDDRYHKPFIFFSFQTVNHTNMATALEHGVKLSSGIDRWAIAHPVIIANKSYLYTHY